jgi:hypothetical protein
MEAVQRYGRHKQHKRLVVGVLSHLLPSAVEVPLPVTHRDSVDCSPKHHSRTARAHRFSVRFFVFEEFCLARSQNDNDDCRWEYRESRGPYPEVNYAVSVKHHTSAKGRTDIRPRQISPESILGA